MEFLWLQGVYPRGLKTYVHTKICTQMFLAVLCIIQKKIQKSISEWMGKQNVIYP
jgi:hypothetical protein